MNAKPVSERRLAANRANALKSTGPRTAEGKRTSSQNACKHHLYAKVHKLPPELEQLAFQDAVARTTGVEDPTLRTLLFHRYYLEGHRAYFRMTEAAILEEALALVGGDQRQADHWLVKQKTHLTALQRYYGSLSRQINRTQRAILRYLTQVGQASACAGLQSRPDEYFVNAPDTIKATVANPSNDQTQREIHPATIKPNRTGPHTPSAGRRQ